MYISINHRTEKFLAGNYKSFTIGVCFTAQVQGITEVLALGFYDKLLGGKTYSIHQVDETIKHELAHMIADLRYNDSCKHDERFMAVVQEIGGEPNQ